MTPLMHFPSKKLISNQKPDSLMQNSCENRKTPCSGHANPNPLSLKQKICIKQRKTCPFISSKFSFATYILLDVNQRRSGIEQKEIYESSGKQIGNLNKMKIKHP